jgi:hypothetical protein
MSMARARRPSSKAGSKGSRAATKQLGLAVQPADTEVEAYGFIRDQLRELGWSVKNPLRHAGGEVWTQGQCLSHPEIKRRLGLTRPENIVKLSETKLWIIEAKSKRALLSRALQEAEDYAWPIQNGGVLSVPLISGVAGNDSTGYEVRTHLLVRGRYERVTINGSEATGLLDKKAVQLLLDTGNPDIADLVIDETLFIKEAEQINRTLHVGGINKNDRARVMAALLLALLEGTPDMESDLPVLISDINTRTDAVLRKHGKREFSPFVRIEPPTNPENHVKFKTAIIQTIQALNNLNIKSAMNSGADVLGKFYEVFLKYGNGAKEIGIVLTPRHVTRFAVQTVGVSPTDIVLDPACGTGGFLVAAFDHVRRIASHQQIERFKKHNLFGIEQESYVAALAIVNMIFRGDGKNNITEANIFSKFLRRAATPDGHATAEYVSTPTPAGEEAVTTPPPAGEEAVTRVFMNPPFALKRSDEKEYRFVEAALNKMVDGGLLFAIVPLSAMAEAGRSGTWRRDTLLPRHTLLAVMSFPEELFYPVANQTVGVIIRKGVPHPRTQNVLWGRIVNDGFRKSKGRRLPTPAGAPNDLERIAPILRGFLIDPAQPVQGVPEFVRAVPIDFADPALELVPEAYVESRLPDAATLTVRLDAQVRENVASLVDIDLSHGADGRCTIIDAALAAAPQTPAAPPAGAPHEWKTFPLDALFELRPGDYHSLQPKDPGPIPVASCGDFGNGVVGTYDIPPKHVYRDALTIAFNGKPLTTKLHPYEFAAKDDVAVAVPKQPLSPEVLVFIQAALNSERWRFSYYRKCFRAKLGRTLLELPVHPDGSLDVDFMAAAVRAQPYWWFLAPRLADWQPRGPQPPAAKKPRRKKAQGPD